MEEIEVVELLEKDYEELISLFCNTIGFPPETNERLLGRVKMLTKHNRFFAFGVRSEVDGPLIGFTSLIPIVTTAWIPYMAISTDYQKRGIGSVLMKYVIEFATSNFYETIELCATKAGEKLYNQAQFKKKYPANFYLIGKNKTQPKQKLSQMQFKDKLPDWIRKFDQKIIGYDRSELYTIHNNEKVTIIYKKDHGFGFLYDTHLGPVIADDVELAKDIILEAISLGAKSLILVEASELQKQIHEIVELILWEGMEDVVYTWNMLYGKPLNQNLDFIYCQRSLDLG
jgi:GNAT superfamily N-acetyltransferase